MTEGTESKLWFRVLPDPVAGQVVETAILIGYHYAAVVGAVPADGIEQKAAGGRGLIMQGFLVDDVGRKGGQEVWCQIGKGCGIISVSNAVLLQTAGDLGHIYGILGAGSMLVPAFLTRKQGFTNDEEGENTADEGF